MTGKTYHPAARAFVAEQLRLGVPQIAIRQKLDQRGDMVPQGTLYRWFAEFHRGEFEPVPAPETPPRVDFTSDKKVGSFSWRHANTVLKQMQELKHGASWSQDEATIRFLEHVQEPICITGLSDLHMGSWAVDYDTIERVTDELLTTPGLYAILLGDEEQMGIKMRNVLEVSDNLLPPAMQHAYFASWLDEVQPKVLAGTWSNHAEMREESQAGYSMSAEIKKRRIVYHNGIGHPDIVVGSQTYQFAVSHVFRGKSMYNEVHGQRRYTRMEAPEREVVMAGDSHVPGIGIGWERGAKQIGMNGGTAQTNSGYAKRHFSLRTAEVWPCVMLFPDRHMAIPFWSVAEWLAATGKS